MRERSALALAGVGAEGATPRETLRHKGRHRWTIWRETLRASTEGEVWSSEEQRIKLSGTETDGDSRLEEFLSHVFILIEG